MKKNLTDGTIGRVLLDRNTAYHLLHKYGLKRNRQIRLIRNINFPLDYNLAHVNRTKKGDDAVRKKLANCGSALELKATDMKALVQKTVKEKVLTAELQVM